MPERDKDIEAALDVARNLLAYGRYGGKRASALKALRRRAKSLSKEECEELLDFFEQVFPVATAAVETHKKEIEPTPGRFAQFDDIDFEAALADLDQVAPGRFMDAKKKLLSWCILYYYLK